MTTISQKRIHGSSTTSKTFRGVEYVHIFQLVINEEDEKIVNLCSKSGKLPKKIGILGYCRSWAFRTGSSGKMSLGWIAINQQESIRV